MEPTLPQDAEKPFPREATRADLDDLPENILGEIIEGRLYTSPWQNTQRAHVVGCIAFDLFDLYDRQIGGPGGWWVSMRPGICLPEAAEVVPDIGGWRRERLPNPRDLITIAPDWVCEVLTENNRSHVLKVRRPFFAKVGVQHMWLVEPEHQTVHVSRLCEGRWLELGSYVANERMRAEPFEATELALHRWRLT